MSPPAKKPGYESLLGVLTPTRCQRSAWTIGSARPSCNGAVVSVDSKRLTAAESVSQSRSAGIVIRRFPTCDGPMHPKVSE